MPMAALIDAVSDMDHGVHTLPALFWYAEADAVVRADVTREIAAAWGGPSTTVNPVMRPSDDFQSQAIAGAVLSPGQTEAAVAGMRDRIAGLI